jgi:hypothetical protein
MVNSARAEFVKTSTSSGDIGVQHPGEPGYRKAERLSKEGIYARASFSHTSQVLKYLKHVF